MFILDCYVRIHNYSRKLFKFNYTIFYQIKNTFFTGFKEKWLKVNIMDFKFFVYFSTNFFLVLKMTDWNKNRFKNWIRLINYNVGPAKQRKNSYFLPNFSLKLKFILWGYTRGVYRGGATVDKPSLLEKGGRIVQRAGLDPPPFSG